MSVTTIPYSRPALVQRSWKPFYWLFLMMLLLVLQLWSGTTPAYALLMTVFCLLTYLAVKETGGPTTLTGFCIFYLAVQNVFVSQIAKLVFWDPADHRLQQPVATIEVYVCAMFGIYLAAVLTRRLGTMKRRPLFLPITDPMRLRWIAYLSTALLVFQIIYLTKGGIDAETGAHNFGGLVGILQQFNFLGLSVTSGTAYMITASQGRRSLGVVNAIGIGITFLSGMLGASREGITSAVVLYFATCFLFRFRFRFINYAVLIGGVCVAQYILIPYALYARATIRTPDMQKNIQRGVAIFLDVLSDPARYQPKPEKGVDRQTILAYRYYDTPNSSLDRFTLIKVNDGLVDATLREGTMGMDTITPSFLMSVPRALYPDKPFVAVSNLVAHREPGLVAKNDHSTGISTGFVGDSFSCYSWPGAVLLPFILMFGWFCALRFIVQDSLWQNIFAIGLFLQLAHNFSEAPLGPLLASLVISPFLYILMFWLILAFVAFAMRTQEKIHAAKRQAVVRTRAEVLAGRRRLISRR